MSLTKFYERVQEKIADYVDQVDYDEFYNNEDYDGESNYYEGMKDWCYMFDGIDFKSDKECYEFIHNDAETLFEVTKYVTKQITESHGKIYYTPAEDIVEVFNAALSYILDELVKKEEDK